MAEENSFEREMKENYTLDDDVGDSSKWGPEYEKQLRVIVQAIILLLSTIGNTLIIQKIINNFGSSCSRPNILFLNLACADCLATVFTVAGQLIWDLMDRAWNSSNEFCKIFKFFQTFGITSSNYMLVAISLDRLWAIVYPLNTHPSAGRLAGVTWLLAVIPCLQNFWMFHTISENPKKSLICVSRFYSDPEHYSGEIRQIYFLILIIVVFLLPFLLTISFHVRIIITLCRQFHRLGGGSPDQQRVCCRPCIQRPNNSSDASSSTERVSVAANRGLIPRARVKVLNLSLAYVVTFLITNIPYVIHEFCIAFIGSDAFSKNTSAIIAIMPPLNSAINPIIYLLFNSQSYIAQVLTTECCPLTSIIFLRLAAFTNHQPTQRRNKSSSSSVHLHRINPELVGAPVHVAHVYPGEIESGEHQELAHLNVQD